MDVFGCNWDDSRLFKTFQNILKTFQDHSPIFKKHIKSYQDIPSIRPEVAEASSSIGNGSSVLGAPGSLGSSEGRLPPNQTSKVKKEIDDSVKIKPKEKSDTKKQVKVKVEPPDTHLPAQSQTKRELRTNLKTDHTDQTALIHPVKREKQVCSQQGQGHRHGENRDRREMIDKY